MIYVIGEINNSLFSSFMEQNKQLGTIALFII